MALRCKHEVALIASGAAAMALIGCSETLSLAKLPNISRLPSKLLSKEEQAKTMNQMLEQGQSHQAEAAKEIEAAGADSAGGTVGIEAGGIEGPATGAAKETAPAK